MKKSYITILLLAMVMILAISAVSAADTDYTSDSDVLSVKETAVDEVVSVEAVDDVSAANEDTEVLSADGDGNFTELQTSADTGMVMMGKDYVRAGGENDISITRDVTILGNSHKIDANNLGGIFRINSGCTLTLIGVTLINGNNEYGGAIYNDGGSATIVSSNFLNNTAEKSGGAIYNNAGSMSITGSKFDGNDLTDRTVNGYGGAAIYSEGGTILLSDVRVTNNLKDIVHRGGTGQYTGDLSSAAVTSKSGSLTVSDSYFANNSGSYGGAILSQGDDSVLNVVGSTFVDNFAFNGGAIDILSSHYTISNCTFRGNDAMGTGSSNTNFASGGAICAQENDDDDGLISDCIFEDNTAAIGGAITTQISRVVACTFTNNTASASNSEKYNGKTNNRGGFGGAIYNDNMINIENSNFTDSIGRGRGLDLKNADITGSSFTNTVISVNNKGTVAVSDNKYDNEGKDISSNTGCTVDVTVGDGDVPYVTSGTIIFEGDLTFQELQDIIDAGNTAVTLSGNVAKTEEEEQTFANGVLIDHSVTIYAQGHTITANNGKVFTVNEGKTLTLDNVNVVGDGTSAIVNNGQVTLKLSAPSTFTNVGEFAIDNQGTLYQASMTTFTQLSDLIALVNGGEIYIYQSKITKSDDEKDTFADGIVIDKDLTVRGYANSKGVISTYLDADNSGRIFSINDGATLTVEKIILKNGHDENGAAVYVESVAKLIANNAVFSENVALDNGGAIYTDGGEITLTDCVLDSNDVTNLETSAAQNMGGAAIYAKNAQVTLVNTNVTNNGRSELDRSNGDLINAVVNLINSNATISGGLFENNTGIYGGAIYAEGDGTQTLTVTGATFNNNKAYNGGAIDVDSGMITSISDSSFSNNLVVGPGSSGYYGAGGAISVGGSGSFSLTDSNFTNNKATGEGATGGAVHNSLSVKDVSSISGCNFTDNTATDRGAAIFNNGYLSLSENVIDDELGIYSNGEIDSQVFVIFMDNEEHTFDAFDSVDAYAKVVDDNGNIIKVNSITLITTGFASGFGGTLFAFNESDNLYHAKVTASKTGKGAATSNPLKKLFSDVTVLSQTITVNPVDRILEVTYENITQGTPLTVDVKLTRAKDGALLSYTTVTIEIGNVTKSVSTRNGVGTVTFDSLTWGNYVINASIKGSASYNPIEQLYNLTVSPVKGTFGDLQYIIDNDEIGLVFLPYDFKYDPEYDADLVNGVVIDKNLYILGNDYTIDANNSARIFNVTNGAVFKIDDATLTNGHADYGGAIYVDDDSFLNTQNVVLYNNTATYRGGAIYSEGTVDVMDSVLDSNDITFRTKNDDNGGAAIYNLNGDLSIVNSNITNNLKDIVIRNGNAGDLLVGVVVTSGYTFIEDSYFANNTGSWGGAISSLGYMNDEPYLLSIENSKFEGNNATFGGAIYVESSELIIDNCTFENNKGVGVGSSGTSNTQGGAIVIHPAGASATITDSTFIANSANTGGAVSLAGVDGDSIIENCTFTDNTANDGGAVYLWTQDTAVVTVANSTFSGNTAGWGNAISTDGALALSNNTISSTSADIANWGGTIESVINVVILNNETVTFSGETLITAKVTDDNNNIIKDINFVFVVNETELGAVFDDASGLYQAIYKNNAAGLYVVNITYNEEENLVVKTATLKNIKGSFTELANIIANADPFTTTVLNGDYAYNEEIDSDLVNGIVIDKELILDGNGTTISGNGLSRIFNITDGDIILHNATLRDAVALYGGAVHVDKEGEFTGYNVNFINNTATYRGGAIYSEGLVQAFYSEFDSNDITFRTANDDNGGAAIYNKNGFLAISDSNITNNLKDIVIREGNAGDLLVGVVVTSGNTFITDSYFANNTGSWGGAISSLGYMNTEDYTLTIRDSKFEGNNATFGGAIFVESSKLVVDNCTFENNKGVGVGSSGTSNTQGGAIIVHPSGSSATITDSTFTANGANIGGAVSLPGVDGESTIENCTFTDNTAGLDGGALYFWTNGAGVTVKDSEFVNNTAYYGGAIENEGIGALTVDNCTFTENTASAKGGAIISSGSTSVSNSVFTDNEGLDDTNAIYLYNEGTTLELSNNTITGGNKVQIFVKTGIEINSKIIATFMNNQTVPKQVGDTAILNATLADDKGNFIYDADFKFSVNGGTIMDIDFDDETGLYTTEYPIDIAGQWIVSTNYELDGMEKYIGILEVPLVNVTEFSVVVPDTREGEDATVWVILKGLNDTGLDAYVTVIVNNEEYSVDVENGEGNINIEDLAHGQYPVVAILDHPNYEYLINSTVFNVKGQSKLNVTELTVAKYGDVIEIAINLTDSEGNPLSGIVVIDETINVLVENGIGTFVIDNQPDVGKYTFQAVYDGDNDYFGDLAIFNVTVNTKVIDSNDVVVDIPTINEFGEAIPVTITSPVDGTYTVNINGTAVDVEVINGVGSANVTLDKAGIYNATVDIAEEGYSLETITTDDFEYLTTPEFNVVITGTYPEAEISITGPAGTYHVDIDGFDTIDIVREESGLPTVYTIEGISAGKNDAIVSFDAHDEYYGDVKEVEFTINKAALNIEEPEVTGDKVVESPINITFTLPTDVDPSNVAAFMDGTPVPIDGFVIDETTGAYTLPLDGFSAVGGHLFTVEVNDPNYEETSAQVSFMIEKAETTVTIDVDNNLGVMGNSTVNITVSNNVSGYLAIDNNGKVSVVEITDGKYSFEIYDLQAGDYYINATFLGNDNYLKSNATKKFSIPKSVATPNVAVTSEIKGGEQAELNITMDNNLANGYVRIYIDGVDSGIIALDEDYANATVTVGDLASGSHTIGIKYLGNDNFEESDIVNVTVDVVKADSKVTIDPIVNVTYGNSVVVYYSIENRTGDVTVSICYNDGDLQPAVEDVDYTVDEDKITINGLDAGNYVVIISNNEDEYYNGDSDYGLFTVEKLDVSDISIEPVTITYGENATVIVNGLPENAAGNVTIVVNNKNYTAKVEDGHAIVEISGLAAGNYEGLAAEYSGDSIYNAADAMCAIYVNKAKSEVTIFAIGDQTYPGVVSINYTVENETQVEITVVGPNGDEVDFAGDDGKVDLTNLPAGEYYITIENKENENFTGYIAQDSFKVLKADPKFTSEVTQDAKVGENVTVSVKALADATGNVTVVVDGEIFAKDIPVVDGAATIDVTGLDAGHHSYEVTYSGDDNYENASDVNSFDVAKAETTVTIDVDDDLGVMGNSTVNVTVSNNVSGYLAIDNNGKVSVVEITDGKYSFEIYDLQAGDYYINVTFLGNDNYLKSNATKEFSIPKSSAATPSVAVTPEIKGGEQAELIVTMDDNLANGYVRIYIDGVDSGIIALDEDYANATVTVGDLASGSHTIGIKYLGNDNFEESDIVNVTVNVVKADSKVTIDPIANVTYGAPVVVYYSIENRTGDVTVSICYNDGGLQPAVEDVDYTVEDGKITINAIDAGDYVIIIINNEDGFYSSSSDEEFFTVAPVKEETNVTIDVPSDVKEGDDASVDVSIPGATGNVTVIVDGKETTVSLDEDGNASVPLENISAGDHNVVVIYSGDDKHNGAYETASFTVPETPKEETDVAIDVPSDVKEGDDASVDVSIPGATGNVTVIVDGKETTVPLDENGSASVPLENISAGDHNVVVIYSGDDTHAPVHAVSSFTVPETPKEETDVAIDVPSDVKEGDDASVDVSIPGATGNVTVIVDGKETTVPLDENGAASVPISDVTAGEHSVVVIYSGDDKHNGTYETASFTVPETPKEEANVTIDVPSDVKEGDDASVDVSIPGATGNVTVIVDGKETIVPLDENGAASVPISDVTAGEHSVVVIYSGDETHAPAHSVSSFTVPETPVVLPTASEFVEITVMDDLNVTMRLVDADGNPIPKAKINYAVGNVSDTTTTAVDGSFTIRGASGVVISVDYAGNETHLATNTSIKFDNMAPERLATQFNVTNGYRLQVYAVDYKAGERGAYFDVLLTDTNGNRLVNQSVVFAINGWVHNKTTDENGVAHLQINLQDANYYTCAPCYLGNTTYNATFASAMIDVIKKPITISAAAKSYKATAKTKKYTVTLKTIKGSSADGKTYLKSGRLVKLTVDGKTYTAKINAKGQATFSLKITKKGKYQATVKFDGGKTYESVSKKATITIN
ncbi:MAG: hypothetical protein E7Z83_00645 [Methanobrevibacter sp.]|nr:Ig-like domain repeat protein [Methanobrevibacter sp.]MBE6489360.1 hypothetical protein [Methanobrevibacter sp.]